MAYMDPMGNITMITNDNRSSRAQKPKWFRGELSMFCDGPN